MNSLSHLKTYTKSVFFFTFFNAFSRALNFIFFTLAAVFLSIEEYGKFELLVTYSGIFIILCSFGFEGYLSREWYEKSKESAQHEAFKILNFAVLISILILITVFLILYFFKFKNLSEILLVISAGAFLGLNTISLVILRLSQERFLFIILQFLQPITYLIILAYLYCLENLPENSLTFLKIYSFSNIFLFFISFLIVRIKIHTAKYKIPWEKFIKYSSAILINSLLGFLFLQSGRFYIAQMLGEENLGIASIILRVNGLQFIFAIGLIQGLLPILFKELVKSEGDLPLSFKFGILFNLISSIIFCFLAIAYGAFLLDDKFNIEVCLYAFFQVLGVGVYNTFNFVNFSIIKNRMPYIFSICLSLGIVLQISLFCLFEPIQIIYISLIFFLSSLAIFISILQANKFLILLPKD